MWHSVWGDAHTYLQHRRLVLVCYNKVHDKILYLYRRAFTSAYIRVEPLIHQGSNRSEQSILKGSDKDKETREDVMVQGLWDCQVHAII